MSLPGKKRIGRPSREISTLVSHIHQEWVESHKPGTRLPGIRKLAGHYNVDHSRVEAALDHLEARELIVRKKRSGTFVAPPKTKRYENLHGKQIGFCLPQGSRDLNPGFCSGFLKGVNELLSAVNVSLVLNIQPWENTSPKDMEIHFSDPQLAGIFLVDCRQENLCSLIKKLGKPLVSIDADATVQGIPSFCFDNIRAGEFLAKRLYLLGHRRIAAVFESTDRPIQKQDAAWFDRRKGFLGEIRQNHIDSLMTFNLEFRSDYASAEKFFRIVLQKPPEKRPTALFVPHFKFLRLAKAQAETLGIRIPQELTIVTCEEHGSNLEGSGIRLDGSVMGKRAARRLLSDIENQRLPNTPAPLTLIKGYYNAGQTHARAMK